MQLGVQEDEDEADEQRGVQEDEDKADVQRGEDIRIGRALYWATRVSRGCRGGGRSDGIPATSTGEGQGRPRDGEGEAAMKQGLRHDAMRGRRRLEGGREQGGGGFGEGESEFGVALGAGAAAGLGRRRDAV